MKKPSLVSTAVKTFVGLLFFIVALDMDGDTIAVSLVIGLAFLAWAVLPHVRFKREMQEAQNGTLSSIEKPGIGAMIAKVTFASMFVIMAFDMDDTSSVLISLLLGAVFLFWACFPFLRYKHAKQTESASLNTVIRESEMPVRKPKLRICPHCGAPMSGDTCEYCGMYSEE